MTYAFHPEAEAEFNGAIDYYEIREAGLGYDFGVEVYSAIQRIVAYPRAGPSWRAKSAGAKQTDSRMGFSMRWRKGGSSSWP